MFIVAFVLHFFFAEDEAKVIDYYYHKSADYSFSYLPASDTIFYLGKNYIEISLKEQRARLISRNDSTLSFRISSGNQYIKEGKSTPEGFYTVQNKSPMAISKQFDNAELFNWIGFNGNIGFHGLKGSGYYGSLGIRPASHSCVRIGREDGQKLYQKVKVGTPVIVYYHKPLRVIQFSSFKHFDPANDFFLRGNSYSIYKTLQHRMQNIYDGNAIKYNNYRIFYDGNMILRRSFGGNGDPAKVPLRQKNCLVIKSLNRNVMDNLKANIYKIISDTSKVDFR